MKYFNLLLYVYINEIETQKDIEIIHNELNKLLDLKHNEKKILDEVKNLNHYPNDEKEDLDTIISWLNSPLTTEFPYKNTSNKNNNYLPVFSDLFKICNKINNNNMFIILNLLD